MHVVCPHCEAVNRIPSTRLEEGPSCGKCHRSLFNGKSTALSSAGFQRQVGRSDLPLLVDFWAPWCGPCKMMTPAFEQAARELEPQMRLLKVNTEEEQAFGAQLGIRSIPTLVLFRNGREVARQPGAMAAAGIVHWVRSHLPS